jgi:hypothetical protein
MSRTCPCRFLSCSRPPVCQLHIRRPATSLALCVQLPNTKFQEYRWLTYTPGRHSRRPEVRGGASCWGSIRKRRQPRSRCIRREASSGLSAGFRGGTAEVAVAGGVQPVRQDRCTGSGSEGMPRGTSEATKASTNSKGVPSSRLLCRILRVDKQMQRRGSQPLATALYRSVCEGCWVE